MAFLLLALLLLLSFFSVMFMHRRTAFVFLGLSLFWIAAVGTGWLPNLLLAKLQTHAPLVQPEWKSKNAIVLLGSGVKRWEPGAHLSSPIFGYSRVSEAARLYLSCKAKKVECTLIPTGGDPGKKGTSEAEVMRRELRALQVADSDIVIEGKSNNTFQNAQFTSEILRQRAPEQTMLVTSGVHMTRSLLYFSHFGVKAIAAPSDQIGMPITKLPTALQFTTLDLALHEVAGVIRFHIYNHLGLNQASAKPGSP